MDVSLPAFNAKYGFVKGASCVILVDTALAPPQPIGSETLTEYVFIPKLDGVAMGLLTLVLERSGLDVHA